MTEARVENRMDEAFGSRAVAPEWIGLLQLSPAQAFAVCHIKRERQHQHQRRKKNHVIVIGLLFFLKKQDFPGIETYRESPELLSLSPALFLKRRFSEGGGGGGRQTSFCPNSDYIAMSEPLFGPKQPNGLICRPGPPHTQRPLFVYITLQKQPRCRAYSSGRSPRLSPSFK